MGREGRDRLTEYATVSRYPGTYEPITVTEARRAVTTARQVRKAIRSLLSRRALRPRSK